MSFADMSQESFTGDAERAVLVGIDYKDAPESLLESSLAEPSRSVLTLRIPERSSGRARRKKLPIYAALSQRMSSSSMKS